MATKSKRKSSSKGKRASGIAGGVEQATNLVRGALDQASSVAGTALDLAINSASAFIPVDQEEENRARGERGYRARRERNVAKAQEVAAKSNKPTRKPEKKDGK